MNSLAFWGGKLSRKACIAIASGGFSAGRTKSLLFGASEWSTEPPSSDRPSQAITSSTAAVSTLDSLTIASKCVVQKNARLEGFHNKTNSNSENP